MSAAVDNLPNGFTGFGHVDDPDFISAGEASRRAREQAARAREAARRRVEEPQPPLPEFIAPIDEDLLSEEPPLRTAPLGMFEQRRPSETGAPLTRLQPGFDGQGELADVDGFDPRDLRWAWAEVDLSAIRHNVAETRRFLKPNTRLMAVVKADGYGHGAVEVARAALAAGADRLAVATVLEGVALRKAGITAPILMLSQPPASAIPVLVDFGITPSVYDPAFAVAYGEAADQRGLKAPYHLVVNTGMNRIGVHYLEVVDFLYQVSFHRALELEGTFTHFATADCPERLEFERQRRRFEDAVIAIRAAGFSTGLVHAANSAAIYRYPEVHYDMVRQGISLYGFHPCNETRGFVDLHPAMSIHARITDVRMVPMSEGVSYGLNYRSPGSVKICTIPLGYADGLREGLSSNTDFIMDGRYYRQVGNICMDQCMFEVDMRRRASVPPADPQVGDHVIVVGQEGVAEVTMDEMAEKLGTIHYELAIGFAQRLPKIYT